MKNPFQQAEPVAKKLKILLYGGSGTGKTRAGLTFPRVAVIDAEGGTDLYAGRKDIAPFAVLRAKTIKEVREALAFIKGDNGKTFDTLMIDPITVLYDVTKEAAALRSKTGDLGYREWGGINQQMKWLYTELTNLPVHVIATAREAVMYETVNGELRKIGVKPEADKTLAYQFDFVVRMIANHSGIIEKSRGVLFDTGDKLSEVNWQAFASVAGEFQSGTTVTQISELDAAQTDAEELSEEPTTPPAANGNGTPPATQQTDLFGVDAEVGKAIQAGLPLDGWNAATFKYMTALCAKKNLDIRTVLKLESGQTGGDYKGTLQTAIEAWAAYGAQEAA